MLYPMLKELFQTKTADEWLEAFEGSSLPYAPINNMSRVFTHPQTLARNMVATVPFPGSAAGSLNLIGIVYPMPANRSFG
jgi:succinate--hydroxymethylglutarate CoA-transferase